MQRYRSAAQRRRPGMQGPMRRRRMRGHGLMDTLLGKLGGFLGSDTAKNILRAGADMALTKGAEYVNKLKEDRAKVAGSGADYRMAERAQAWPGGGPNSAPGLESVPLQKRLSLLAREADRARALPPGKADKSAEELDAEKRKIVRGMMKFK